MLWSQAAALVVSLSVGSTRGSGNIKEEARQVGNFSGISVGSGIQATATIGPNTSVMLRGDDNLLPMIRVEVVNGKLIAEVRTDNWISPTEPIKLTVVSPKLTSAAASGGARLTAEATAGPEFTGEASGGAKVSVKGADSKSLVAKASGGSTLELSNVKVDSADVEGSGGATIWLAGAVKTLKTHLSGGAGLKAQDAPVEALRVHASGGSRVYAQASSELSAQLSGGATVHLKGNPAKRQVDTSGGSKVYYE
jgi:hypothetical protein